MIFIHILFFPLTTPSLSGLSGSLGRNSITLSGGRPGLGPRSDPGTLGAAPGQRAGVPPVPGFPLPGARPALPCPAAPQASARPFGDPGATRPHQQAAARRDSSGGEGPGGRAARAPNSPWPKSRERAHSPESQGAGNARCPGDDSWAPRPVP